MKVLIACDKFKGTASSVEINEAISTALLRLRPSLQIATCSIADGGEGSLDMIAAHTTARQVRTIVSDPLFRPISAYYLRLGNQAYIEMAQASGLQLLSDDERSAYYSSSYGTGQLVLHALKHGSTQIFLLIGGSATNDGGIGAATALGYRFFNEEEREILPIGKNLVEIHKIDNTTSAIPRNARITLLSDVQNPLLGPNGATYTYGPQKGLDRDQAIRLEAGLTNLEQLVNIISPDDLSAQKGMGAAGGIGVSFVGLMGAVIEAGTDWAINITGMEEKVSWADVVITGEGRFDTQSTQGKVFSGINQLCKKYNKPLAIICGQSELTSADLSVSQVKYIGELISFAKSEVDAKENWQTYLNQVAANFVDSILA